MIHISRAVRFSGECWGWGLLDSCSLGLWREEQILIKTLLETNDNNSKCYIIPTRTSRWSRSNRIECNKDLSVMFQFQTKIYSANHFALVERAMLTRPVPRFDKDAKLSADNEKYINSLALWRPLSWVRLAQNCDEIMTRASGVSAPTLLR